MTLARVKLCTIDKKDEMTLPLIEEAFKQAGIEIEIRSHYDTAYDGLFIGQKGLASIFVLKEDEERSREILNDLLEGGQ